METFGNMNLTNIKLDMEDLEKIFFINEETIKKIGIQLGGINNFQVEHIISNLKLLLLKNSFWILEQFHQCI